MLKQHSAFPSRPNTRLTKHQSGQNQTNQQLFKDTSSLQPHLHSPGHQKQNPANQNRILESWSWMGFRNPLWRRHNLSKATQQGAGRFRVRTSNSKLGALHPEFYISTLPPFPGQEFSVQGPKFNLPRAVASKLF